MAAPLDNRQKRYLAQLARDAWRQAGPELDGMTVEDYRHNEIIRITGKHGLRCCSQDDYGAVKGHFLNLLGRTAQAFRAIHHGEGNARRVAWFKLNEACERAGVNINYAAVICRAQFKCELPLATDRQLWCLTFTIRNRRSRGARPPRAQWPAPRRAHFVPWPHETHRPQPRHFR